MSTTTTLLRRPRSAPLLGLFVVFVASSCAFFTLEAPCDSDANCPFGRVCASTNVCEPPSSAGEGEGVASGEGEGVGGGEGEGEGEGEGAAFVPCSGVTEVDGDVVLPGDEARVTPAGNTCIHVHGRVEVSGAIATLHALQRVQQIDNDLQVQDTTVLTDFRGCEQLSDVGGSFSVRSNQALSSFDGLDALTNINGCDIADNPNLSPSALAAFETRCH